MKRIYYPVKIKHPFNALSHFVGIFLSTAALVFLVSQASLHASSWHVVSFAIFGTTMTMVYVASTLYHWLPLKPSQEKTFRRIDRTAIYFKIAGSYTPVCVVALRGTIGWSVLGTIWALAILGVGMTWTKQVPRKYMAAVYLFMGWVSLIAIYPVAIAISMGGTFWLVAGGASYSIGAIIYAVRKPTIITEVIGPHEIFHVFVMLGSLCHFWMMYAYILPLP